MTTQTAAAAAPVMTVTIAAPAGAATAPSGHAVTLDISEDAYQGDAQFIITVDGVQYGGTQTAQVLHGHGEEAFVLAGVSDLSPHNVSVTFLNDLYAGSAATDRNLYVDGDTTSLGIAPINAALLSSGSTSRFMTASSAVLVAPTTSVTIPAAAGQTAAAAGHAVTLDISEDAYQGDAQFIITVDGAQYGGTQTADILHSSGGSEAFVLAGVSDTASHSIGVTFINDLYGGTAATDRNLYVNSITTSAGTNAVNTELYSSGNTSTSFLKGTAATATAGALSLVVAEDAYLGNAQFTVSVDGVQVGGVQTATALNGSGATQTIALGGAYSTGNHLVSVTFLNDLYAGSASTDRNLYVKSATIGGTTTAVNAALLSTGSTAAITVNATAVASLPTPVPVPVPTPAPVVPTPTPAPTPAPVSTGFTLLGVNLSGAEFDAGALPGVLNQDYTYPTHAEIDYYASKGLDVIRLPFLWERMQPTQNGPLDKAQLAAMDDVVNYANSKGIKVDLDLHNYGYAYGNEVGSAGTPDSSFANFWSQLATHYESNSNVLFGLMNEPHDQGAQQWANTAQAAITAIRATGATSQEILVSGTAWDGGESWASSGNAAVMAATIHDPSHNMAFEIHQYLDSDSSGTSTTVVSPTIGVERLEGVTQWAETNGFKLFLGEFGSGSDPAGVTAVTNMLTYMQAHTDAWQGGTEWGGGPWWGNYAFSVEPSGGVDKSQITALDAFAPKHA